MSEQERDAVIDECIRAVLSLRDEPAGNEAEREDVDVITGAACFRLLRLKARHVALRKTLAQP